MIATQYHSTIQVLRSNNGGEFISQELKQYLVDHGITHQTTCPYTPQQNGVAECKNHQLLEIVRASLFEAHLPIRYWRGSHYSNNIPHQQTTLKYLIVSNSVKCSSRSHKITYYVESTTKSFWMYIICSSPQAIKKQVGISGTQMYLCWLCLT